MAETSKSLQVYVVEDSPIIRQLITSVIEGAAAELVGSSASAEQAIREIPVLQPDLILIDISLDSGNGFDVLRVLRERHIAQSARKVVLTNHSNAQYRELSFRLGADQFCDKTLDMWQVLALIQSMAVGRGTSRGHSPGS